MVLLTKNPKLDTQDLDGKTAVHYAALANAGTCIELLIQAGANVKHKCRLGKTPFHYAAEVNATFAIKCLIGIDIGIKSKYFFSSKPLHFSAESNVESATELILKYGNNFKSMHSENKTAPTIAASKMYLPLIPQW